MSNGTRTIGVLRNWNDRGFGIIVCGPFERYFLHISQIRSGTREPLAGQTIMFDVSDKQRKPGDLPRALDADVIMEEVGVGEPVREASVTGVAK